MIIGYLKIVFESDEQFTFIADIEERNNGFKSRKQLAQLSCMKKPHKKAR
jgi:hypothetical protein